jgi:hypothetical protein
LTEHKQIKWLSLEELKVLDWADADVPIVNYIKIHRNGNTNELSGKF